MLTRRDLIIKWSGYALASIALLLLFSLTLRDARVLGVRLFLPPLLVAVVASLEETRPSVIFGLSCGVLCDLIAAGVFPCVYTLVFTAAALFCSLLAKSVLQPGLFCSFAVTVLTFVILDSFNMLALGLGSGAPLLPMLMLTLRETAASCLLVLVCHPVLLAVHRKFTL